jgi:hypothetical protein
MDVDVKEKTNQTKQDQLQQRDVTARRGRGGQRPRPRKPRVFPELGQPGGRDDPRRLGLSGAGTRWYLRFLEQGLEPDEARKRAVEKKVGQGQLPQKTDSVKRGTQEITPQKEKEAKKMRVDAAGTSAATASGHVTTYAETTKLIKVAVLAKEYPEKLLSADELTQLEDAIISEVAGGATCKIQFGGIHFRPGYVVVDCVNKETSEWLKQRATQLKDWKGVELMACLGDDIPRAHNVTIYFPRSAGKEAKFVLSLVEAQNEGLCTHMWKVLRSKDESGGKLLTIGIDDLSCEKIRADGHRIYFRFGKIPVHGLQRPAHSGPLTEEAKDTEGKEKEPEQASGNVGSVGDVVGVNQGCDLDISNLNIATPENFSSTEDKEEMLLESDGEETQNKTDGSAHQ